MPEKNGKLHVGHRKRMYDRFLEEDFDSFADHQIIEMLLFYCYPQIDTNDQAHEMIDAFGSYSNLVEADPREIMKRCGVTLRVACLLAMIPGLCKRYEMRRWEDRPLLDSREAAMNYVRTLFIGDTVECFYVVCLSASYQLNNYEKIGTGTLTSSIVDMQALARTVLRYNTVHAILAHNHPSGSIEPSYDDRETTKTIIEFLKAMGVTVVDHMIVGGTQVYSFSKKGVCGLIYI